MSRVRETCEAGLGPGPQDPGAGRTGELSSEPSQPLRYKTTIGSGYKIKPQS